MDFNLAAVYTAIADAVPDRECIVQGARRLTYREVDDRVGRVAALFRTLGLGIHREDEMADLLRSTETKAIVYNGAFAPAVERAAARVPSLEYLIKVDDSAGSYEDTLRTVDPEPVGACSPDDLYAICTGGTTGTPKAVLWRQADIFAAVMAAQRDEQSLADLDRVLAFTQLGPKYMPTSPFMHGSAQWFAFVTMSWGGTIVLPEDTSHFSAREVLRTAEVEGVVGMSIVGEAFARPLADELARHSYALDKLLFIASGGAGLSPGVRADLLRSLPHLRLVDTMGSSETGAQGQRLLIADSAEGGTAAGAPVFPVTADTAVLSEDRSRLLAPSDKDTGWLARRGAIPLGYLGDQAKTERTFPTVDGERLSVPGDRVELLGDGTYRFLGRDATTINTGGEKVFTEEVEAALLKDVALTDVLVVGRPSDRWGEEVVALAVRKSGDASSEDEIRERCAQHIARYKVPKAIVFVDAIPRTATGKTDYPAARERVVQR